MVLQGPGALEAQMAFQQLEDEAPERQSLAKDVDRDDVGVLGLHGKARLKVRYSALQYRLFPMGASGKQFRMHPLLGE